MNAELLEKFIQGQCTPDEIREVQQWLQQSDHPELSAWVNKKWQASSVPVTENDKVYMMQRVLHKVLPLDNTGKKRSAPVRYLNTHWWRWAAACVLLLAAFWWWQGENRQRPPTSLVWHSVRNDSADRIKKVQLPDGSLVLLNANAEIRYPSNYNDTTREVQLIGEAFFEVTHNATRPFIVHAEQVMTKVYGTAFNVYAYPNAEQLRVALQKGRIGVTIRGKIAMKEQMLVPGALLVYNRQDSAVMLEQQSPNLIGAWTNGRMVFYKTPLRDVLQQLEARYQVQFHYPDDLPSQTITAHFENVPLQKVLRHLAFVWNLHFREQGNQVLVQPAR